MNVVLTALGLDAVNSFNILFRYARCTRCGLLGCPPRDGYAYNCNRPQCDGKMEQIDPRTLGARFHWGEGRDA